MAQKFALVIGNSEYEDQNLASLITPAADVNALASILRDPEVGGFDDVTALVNEPVAAIRRAVSSFFVEKGRDDLLLLYFSGHGMRDDRGQLYLAAKDTEHRLLRGTAIAASFITEEMDNSRSRRQVLVLDCCHSGAFSRGMKGTPGASVGTAAAFEGTGSGRVVLTASDSTQYAWEGDRVIGEAQNSVFTHYLIQGLRTGEADTDADGRITLDELYDYVYELVVQQTPMQTPSKWSYGQQGDIVLARNPRPVIKPAELPADLQQTLEDPRPWVRESSLRELERLMRGAHRGLAFAAVEALRKLTEDDSRRVAAAAAETLSSFQGSPPPGTASSEPPAREAEGGKPQVVPPPVETPAPKSGPAEEPGDHAMQPRVVSYPAAKTPVKPQTASRAGLFAALLQAILRRPVLALALGWAAGGVLGPYFGWYSGKYWGFFVNGLIFGSVTGLVLRHRQGSFHLQRFALLCAAWGIGVTLGQLLSDPLGSVLSGVIAYGWWLGAGLAGGIGGALGGMATGLAMRGSGISISKKSLWMIALGWGLGYGIMWVMGLATGELTHWENLGALMAGYALGGLIAGALGAKVMFSQLAPATDPEKPLAPAPSG